MSYLDTFLRAWPGVVPQRAIGFCRFLESRGQRFCIDFGYENAEDITWDWLEREEERRVNLGGKGAVVQ